jgi:hypothetical protein
VKDTQRCDIYCIFLPIYILAMAVKARCKYCNRKVFNLMSKFLISHFFNILATVHYETVKVESNNLG